MSDIFSVVGVVFVMMSVGFLAVRSGLFSSPDMAVLGKFVVNFALPALVIRAVTNQNLSEVIEVGYLGGYLIGFVLTFSFGFFWSRSIEKRALTDNTFDGMGISCANSGFVGYPILMMALPAFASKALALNMIVENLFMIPLVLVLAEYARGGAGFKGILVAKVFLRLFKNPIVISLLIGLTISIAGIELPTILAHPIDTFAKASSAVSLFVIGGSTAALSFDSIDRSAIVVVFGKLILHPIAVFLGIILMSSIGYGISEKDLSSAAIIMAATPAMSVYPILAQRYGDGQTAALSMLLMTLLSFVTLTVTLTLTL